MNNTLLTIGKRLCFIQNLAFVVLAIMLFIFSWDEPGFFAWSLLIIGFSLPSGVLPKNALPEPAVRDSG